MKDNPSYIVTLLLATFPTGWIGLHHIYLGNRYKGLLYFLFVWTLIPVIASYIDVLLLVKRGQDYFVDEYYEENNKEEYYMRKLAENNPDAIDAELLEEVTGVKKQSKNKDDNSNKNNQESKNKEVDNEESNDEKDENYIDEPDYSDYYGSFD